MAETATLTIQVPASLLKYGLDTERIQERFNQQAVIDLFVEGQITSGQAAVMLGMTRLDFLDLLHARGVPYFDYTREELEREQEVLDEALAKHPA